MYSDEKIIERFKIYLEVDGDTYTASCALCEDHIGLYCWGEVWVDGKKYSPQTYPQIRGKSEEDHKKQLKCLLETDIVNHLQRNI
ncbi:hypothetical protein [Orenia marismortui]|uniref:Uncharacterized protein n=1 Tax=Orenia marismortui TaxID=46469 RepID=A0A4R8GT16_9FIRM|nr:hypothetical protein [Orenia marismortui]TDX49115.1 hypothetical protein C7959_1209 [Orenia marismortui]